MDPSLRTQGNNRWRGSDEQQGGWGARDSGKTTIPHWDNVHHRLGPFGRKKFLLGNKRPSSWMCDCPSLNMPTSPSSPPAAWSEVPSFHL